MSAKITAKLLRKHGACKDQVALFEKLWPKGASVTRANALKAAENRFDLNWLADRLLPTAVSEKLYADIDPAYRQHLKDTAPANLACWKADDVAQAEYDKAVSAAKRKRDAAYKRNACKYRRDAKKSYDAYLKISIPPLVRALNRGMKP